MMNVSVANRQIFGELGVLAEMLRVGWMVSGFRGLSAIAVAPVARDAADCEQEEHERRNEVWPSPKCSADHEECYLITHLPINSGRQL